MESGKKAGEFYTPHQVSEVMARIVSKLSEIQSIYDPTVGGRVIIVTRCINAFKLRVSETLTKYISSLLRVIKV